MSPRSLGQCMNSCSSFSAHVLLNKSLSIQCHRARQVSLKHQKCKIFIWFLRWAQKSLLTSHWHFPTYTKPGAWVTVTATYSVTVCLFQTCPCAPQTPFILSGPETQGFSEGGAGTCNSLNLYCVKTDAFQSGLYISHEIPSVITSANKQDLGAFI